jgi:endonuclease/exonuclease/phosphatase family metal-dependent hydrolase
MTALASAAQDLETDSFAPPDAKTALPRRVVAATYNIRYGVGPWLITGGLLRRAGLRVAEPRAVAVLRNLERAARALAGRAGFPAADIIALQEADNATKRAGGCHVARELARFLSMRYAHAPSRLPRAHPQEEKQWYLDFEEIIRPDDPGDTGVALLSRFPFADATRINLPWTDCPWRPRTALGGKFGDASAALRVFNSHIDPHAPLDRQLAQHETVLSYAESAAGPTVLLGDFNTLTPRARRETRLFLESQGYRTPLPNGTATWRAGAFTNHTDWIFVRAAKITRWGVARRLRSVSDHWPVWAEVDLSAS